MQERQLAIFFREAFGFLERRKTSKDILKVVWHFQANQERVDHLWHRQAKCKLCKRKCYGNSMLRELTKMQKRFFLILIFDFAFILFFIFVFVFSSSFLFSFFLIFRFFIEFILFLVIFKFYYDTSSPPYIWSVMETNAIMIFV